jgi:hypothetical protein
MMRRLSWLGALAMLAATLSACVVRERTVARPGYCAGGVWIGPHYGRYGGYHRGHWRCPGVVERVEID